MKVAISLAVIIGASAFAAPTEDLFLKKSPPYGLPAYGGGAGYGGASSYGAPSYSAPCGAAPIALYLSPQSSPHYRGDAPEDHEHTEQARSYGAPVAGLSGYGAAANYGAVASYGAGAGYGAGAVGLFPHAKVGGCGVPLLLSCAPHVVAGHLAHAKHAAYPAVPSYKQNEEEETTELREAKEKWADAAREATNHADHHHHHISLKDHEVPAEHTKNAPI